MNRQRLTKTIRELANNIKLIINLAKGSSIRRIENATDVLEEPQNIEEPKSVEEVAGTLVIEAEEQELTLPEDSLAPVEETKEEHSSPIVTAPSPRVLDLIHLFDEKAKPKPLNNPIVKELFPEETIEKKETPAVDPAPTHIRPNDPPKVVLCKLETEKFYRELNAKYNN